MSSRVLVFSCNWDGWSCVEAAASAGLRYPASVRVMRVSCLSRLHAGLLLKAFEFGAEGVMLLGCQPETCHYDSESQCISREFEKAKCLLDILGIPRERLALVRLPAYDGEKFVAEVTKFANGIEPPSSKSAREESPAQPKTEKSAA